MKTAVVLVDISAAYTIKFGGIIVNIIKKNKIEK